MSELKRRYDIGGGIVISDDGYSLRAEKKLTNGSSSTGIKRPIKDLGDELSIVTSIGQDFFYLPIVASMHGFWMSVVKYGTKEAFDAAAKSGIFGKAGVELTNTETGDTYWREMLHFASWDLKSDRTDRKIPKSDEMVKDYLATVQGRDREDEKRFNEFISDSGKTLSEIMEKIGWTFEPIQEIPITKI